MEHEIFDALSTPLNKKQIFALANDIQKSKPFIKTLIALTLSKNEQVSFRASWILETIVNCYRTNLHYIVYRFLHVYPQQTNGSSQRHFTKILGAVSSAFAPITLSFNINDYSQSELLVNTTFEWLINDDTPVAVKCNCLDILLNFSSKHPWVKEELLQTIDYLVERESVSFFARAKKVRKKLLV